MLTARTAEGPAGLDIDIDAEYAAARGLLVEASEIARGRPPPPLLGNTV